MGRVSRGLPQVKVVDVGGDDLQLKTQQSTFGTPLSDAWAGEEGGKESEQPQQPYPSPRVLKKKE